MHDSKLATLGGHSIGRGRHARTSRTTDFCGSCCKEALSHSITSHPKAHARATCFALSRFHILPGAEHLASHKSHITTKSGLFFVGLIFVYSSGIMAFTRARRVGLRQVLGHASRTQPGCVQPWPRSTLRSKPRLETQASLSQTKTPRHLTSPPSPQ